jgi:Uncharacterized protein conserved in bacteria
MNLLLCGAQSEYAIERFYLRYLKELVNGHVELFAAQNMFLEYYNRSLAHKVVFRLGYEKIYKDINRAFLAKVDQFKPDVVFVFKGMEIFPETLFLLKQRGIKLVNYNPDNPFLFSGRGSGNTNVTNSIELYDLHFTYDPDIQKQLLKYSGKTSMLPFGFELNDSDYLEVCKVSEINKVCFLGNPDEERAKFINQLSAHVPMVVYGHRWSKFLKPGTGLTLHAPVYGIDFWKVLRQYRVQLNLMRPHNPQSHNMRTFEVPGAGSIGLYPDTPDHRNYFIADREVFLYRNMQDCIEKSLWLLNLSFDEALEIRNSVREKSILSGYTYADRAKETYRLISELR